MAYNSSGTFSRLFDWTDDRDNGIKIRADRFDQELDGFATGLTTTLLKDGTQTATAIIPFAVGLSILDNQSAIFGTNSDYTLQYDEATRDALILASNVEGAAFKLTLAADQGDDASDEWQVGISTGGVLSIGNDIASAQTYVSQLTLTPHATVASSTTAVLGNLTVGGSLSLGSAVIAEAELEMLDGITAGTVIASKAIVTDSDKDITGGRNITITGELDAATGDFSGDVDVDGTLEADAITVNGTALATVIAGTTVTNATNSAHVSVADNENTNEENLIPFIEDASATGNVGLESDGDFAYNPSTGTVSATVFKGNIDAVDGDFDGTLEADAITLDGTAITATATLSTGISNNNVPKFTSGVADDDFLRVNGTSIEGRSASEVLSDIGASAVAGSSSIVTTGALNAGSITSGFGTIDTGSSNITSTGVGAFGSLDISGDIDVDGTTNLDVVDIDGAVDMASTLGVTGVVTANAGVKVDNITIDGQEIDVSSGDLNLDVAGDINLDTDAGEINLKDGGTLFGLIINSSTDLVIQSATQDKDLIFKGNDGGAVISALTLDMSDGGTAIFNHDVKATGNFDLPNANSFLLGAGHNVIQVDANTTYFYGGGNGVQFRTADNASENITFSDTGAAVFNEQGNDADFRVESNGNANAFLVDAGADTIVFGQSAASGTGNGGHISLAANNAHLVLNNTQTSDVTSLIFLNRQGADGTLMSFLKGNSTKGSISVSGATVSFNGFSGRHESSGILANTLVGTVVSTIDALDVYPNTTTNAEGNVVTHPEAGQTRGDHAKVEISTSQGDPCVYGVVSEFDCNGKLIVASVGIGSVRVTGACSKGDLLESNGDGTAKVQSDDIIRSKTIGKVTIGNSETDVKLVSCVLYCG